MTKVHRCVVTGYASVDLKFATESFTGVGHTTLVKRPLSAGEPHPGAVTYFARSLRRNGLGVDLVSWLGSDDKGRVVLEEMTALGVGVSGLSLRGKRSPTSYMFYGPSGAAVTYYDAGDVDQSLTQQQQNLLARADSVLVGIGPAEATLELLDHIPGSAQVMWAVKADPASVPSALASALARRADIVCLSAGEEDFVAQTCGMSLVELSRQGALVVRTDGAKGASCLVEGEIAHRATVDPVDAEDATGAGDTFAAGLLARLIGGAPHSADDIQHALEGASADAHALLQGRQKERGK